MHGGAPLHWPLEMNGRTNGVRPPPWAGRWASVGRIGSRNTMPEPPGPGQTGVVRKVSLSDAQVSNRALLFPSVAAFWLTYRKRHHDARSGALSAGLSRDMKSASVVAAAPVRQLFRLAISGSGGLGACASAAPPDIIDKPKMHAMADLTTLMGGLRVDVAPEC